MYVTYLDLKMRKMILEDLDKGCMCWIYIFIRISCYIHPLSRIPLTHTTSFIQNFTETYTFIQNFESTYIYVPFKYEDGYDLRLSAHHSKYKKRNLVQNASLDQNLDKIIFIINHLNNEHNIKKITLLVIPGLEWNDEQIKIFNEWENNQNIELASHGWIHESNPIKSIYHF